MRSRTDRLSTDQKDCGACDMLRTPAHRLKRSRTAFAFLVLAASIYFAARWGLASGRIHLPIDFHVFWLSGGRAPHEIYADHPMPFVYPPTALPLFKLVSLLPFIPSYFVWITVSALLFGFGVMRVCGARIAALSFFTPAATKGFLLGQSAMLLGGALYGAIRLSPIALGTVFGLVAAVKPQLVLFAPLAFLIRREWKTLIGMAGSYGLAVLVSLIAYGPAIWVDWVRAFPNFHNIIMRFNVLSMAITPAGRAEYLGLPPLPVLLGSAAIGVAAVVVMAKRVEGELLIALIAGASLAASPYAHTHDTMALIPACFALLLKGSWPMAIVAAMIITGTAALTPIGLLVGLVIAALCRPGANIASDKRQARNAFGGAV